MNGDAYFEQLLIDLAPMLRREAARFGVPGMTWDDQLQEARIGLWEAVRSFDPAAGASLKTFANVVVRRRMVDALKRANRVKHRSLNGSVRQAEDEEGFEVDVVDLIADAPADPVLILERRADVAALVAAAATLSPFERWVHDMFVAGCTYEEIAEATGTDPKGVDNALQRSRRKFARALEEAA